jgi:hypothetical protein
MDGIKYRSNLARWLTELIGVAGGRAWVPRPI